MLVQCDNAAVVSIINHKNPEAMHLTRCLVFIAAKWEFHLVATHIKGMDNTLADILSLDNLVLFRSLHPQADREPSTIPEALLDVLIISRPDWTSRSWTEVWSTIRPLEEHCIPGVHQDPRSQLAPVSQRLIRSLS